ncbi:MAG: DUF1963 domain-containing protein [Myxococcales bacterium]
MPTAAVTTRTFERERNGQREFLEVTWTGLEAQVTRGQVGSSGLSTEHTFESEPELERFLEAQRARADRDGFVERTATDEGDGETGELEGPDEAEQLARAHRLTCFVPILSKDPTGGEATGSRFGGRPWLLAEERWPACGRCHAPLTFVVQLAAAQLPGELGPLGEGLLQLFLCLGECQSLGGWEPFAPSTLARLIPARLGQVGEAAAGGCYPARGVERWEPRADYPRYEDLSKLVGMETAFEALETMRERGYVSQPGEKLGGWPHWIQEALRPRCRRCSQAMAPLLQIDSHCTLPVQFGDSGIGWLFRCGGCGELTFSWQCC